MPDGACSGTRYDQKLSKLDNAERSGIAAAYHCKGNGGNDRIRDWLTIEALQGGRKAVPQLGLAELYLAVMAPDGKPRDDSFALDNHAKEPAEIGKLLDDSLVDTQLTGRPAGEIAYVHQRVKKAIEVFKGFNAKAPARGDQIARWFDAWEKDPETYQLLLAFHKAVPDNVGFDKYAFGERAPCKRVHDKVFEIAPLDQPTNSNELAKRFNTLTNLGLLEIARDCGNLQGHPGDGEAFQAIADEVRYTARYGGKDLFPGGDVDTSSFTSPFGRTTLLPYPSLADNDKSACWGRRHDLRAALQMEEDLGMGWGEVATRKDTPDGVLVTFKKAVWMQDKIESAPRTDPARTSMVFRGRKTGSATSSARNRVNTRKRRPSSRPRPRKRSSPAAWFRCSTSRPV